jgi:NADH dehydrogenase [ubiquinone] 1 alpha subcomplex assembly factor 5
VIIVSNFFTLTLALYKPSLMTNIPQIFNKKKIILHRNRAARNIQNHNFLLSEVASRLVERLNDMSRNFENILNIGGSEVSHLLASKDDIKMLVNQDISINMVNMASGLKIVADSENIPFANGTFDLVTSNLSLHSANDLPGALVQILKLLKPDGLFVASLYGAETLHELRVAAAEAEMAEYAGMSPRIAPFADVKTLGHLTQRIGFELPVADSETIKVSYNNALELMHDLRGMGEANALFRQGRPIGKKLLHNINKIYTEKFGDGEGGIIATFDIVVITGIAPKDNRRI